MDLPLQLDHHRFFPVEDRRRHHSIKNVNGFGLSEPNTHVYPLECSIGIRI